MELMTLTLPLSGEVIAITIERKKMKTCRLRVLADRTVRLSVPKSTSKRWIETFLAQKSIWIDRKRQAFADRPAISPAPTELKDGAVLFFLGEPLTLSITAGTKPAARQEGNTLYLTATDPADRDKLAALIDRWWRAESLTVLLAMADRFFPIVAAQGAVFPHIRLRKMKTLWGSCSAHKNSITLNQYLTKAMPFTIEYVVFHELSHLIHPNHSPAFYGFLSAHMPDWKERKAGLNGITL